jgi:transcriptional regulator with GAF, ATPase, and Fis domain
LQQKGKKKMTQHNPNQDDELQILEQRVRKAIENNNRDEAMLLLKQAREAYDRVRRAMGEITTSELNSSYVEVFEKLRDYKKREGVHSEIDVPMVQGDKVIGVLHLNYDTPRQFTDNEFDTIESLAKQAVNALSLPEKINGESLAFNSLTLTGNDSEILTPNFLATKLSPYLNALSEIQNIISDVLKQKHHEIRIRMIAQNSPISVSLDGAAEAVQAVRDTVIPWRRKHAETMAHLLEQEKIAEIELKKAEVLIPLHN